LQIWTVPASGGTPKSLTSAPRGNRRNATDPVHQRDVHRRWLGWFEKRLK